MAKLLKEYRLEFIKIPFGEDPINPSALGLRSKLGGEPVWEQTNETPICSSCNNEMSFIAQIDSIEHDSEENTNRIDCLSDDQEYMFGDVGIIYVFFCFDCCETKSVFQCT